MTSQHLHKSAAFSLSLLLAVHLQGCQQPSPVETLSVSLKNTEVYQYPTVGGDEDGARISVQASHYSISEIRRNAETNWVAVYVYRPAAGFVGADYAELEIVTGSDGASQPTAIKKVAFRFFIRN